eukprot:403352221
MQQDQQNRFSKIDLYVKHDQTTLTYDNQLSSEDNLIQLLRQVGIASSFKNAVELCQDYELLQINNLRDTNRLDLLNNQQKQTGFQLQSFNVQEMTNTLKEEQAQFLLIKKSDKNNINNKKLNSQVEESTLDINNNGRQEISIAQIVKENIPKQKVPKSNQSPQMKKRNKIKYQSKRYQQVKDENGQSSSSEGKLSSNSWVSNNPQSLASQLIKLQSQENHKVYSPIQMQSPKEYEDTLIHKSQSGRFQKYSQSQGSYLKSNNRFFYEGDREIIFESKNITFDNEQAFVKVIIDQLNYLRPDQGKQYIYRITPSYIILQCICKNFQIWYNYSKNQDGDIIDIKFSRGINQQHVKAKHKDQQQ